MLEVSVIIALVVAITEFAKRMGFIPRFLPAVSLVLGITAGLFYIEGDMRTKVAQGLMIGLSAAGLFDQTKIVTKRDDQ